MRALRVGDEVLTANARGDKVFEPVTFFGHGDREAVTVMTQLELADHKVLHMSPRHFIPVCPINGQKCEYHEHIHKYSKNLESNDYAFVSRDEKFELTMVNKVSSVAKKGLFNPYTVSGKIIVNDVLASAHSEWILDNYVPEALVRHLPAIYNALFIPMRIIYYLSGERGVSVLDLSSPMVHPHGYGNEISVAIVAMIAAFGVLAARK